MLLSNTEYGKAYEYACLSALRDHISINTPNQIAILETPAYLTALAAFQKANALNLSSNLIQAANAAARVIVRLEPQLQYGNGVLTLEIQSDSAGIGGDVRDVVCLRDTTGWEVGISCKHNHHAAKHSRLSATIDFGEEWFGVPCSPQYFQAVTPLFNDLKTLRENAVKNSLPLPLWNDIPDKADRYYMPILTAFLAEMNRLAMTTPDIPGKLIRYMLGRYDFYKVITDDRHKTTRVEAINLTGTLNKPANGHHSIVDVPKLKLPTRFYHMGIVPGSDNKVEIVCDEGWTLTMRIHNASSKIEPSLKFDVQLVSLPSSIHAQVEPW